MRGDGVFGRWDIAQELFQKEKNEILLPSNKEEQRVFYNVATSLAQLMKSADAIFFIYPDQFIEKNIVMLYFLFVNPLLGIR